MTKTNRTEEIKNIVFEAIREHNPSNLKEEIGLDISMFGSDGFLDSLGLVTLLVNIEQKIEASFNMTITIADEKAMSLSRSPFKSIGSLVQYLDLRLSEQDE